jgi:hypothetical protein
MIHSLFLSIQFAVEAHMPYFVQGIDGSRKLNFSSIQSITVALRMFIYGVTTNFIEEYLKIREATTIESQKMFVKKVVSMFSEQYLRPPSWTSLG